MLECYVAVMLLSATGEIEKSLTFKTEAEAIAHVEKFKDKFPNAFERPCPNGPSQSEWRFDPVTKQSSIAAPVVIPPRVDPTRDKLDALAAEISSLKAKIDVLEGKK